MIFLLYMQSQQSLSQAEHSLTCAERLLEYNRSVPEGRAFRKNIISIDVKAAAARNVTRLDCSRVLHAKELKPVKVIIKRSIGYVLLNKGLRFVLHPL